MGFVYWYFRPWAWAKQIWNVQSSAYINCQFVCCHIPNQTPSNCLRKESHVIPILPFGIFLHDIKKKLWRDEDMANPAHQNELYQKTQNDAQKERSRHQQAAACKKKDFLNPTVCRVFWEILCLCKDGLLYQPRGNGLHILCDWAPF